MSKIVGNTEIHLQHCLCESRSLKIGKSNHRRCSVKKVSFKILQNLQKRTCVRVRHCFSTDSFTRFLKTIFLQNTSGRLLDEEAWWSKILIPSSFLKKIFVEIIGIFNSESFWKKELCNSPCWPLGSTLNVNFQPGLNSALAMVKALFVVTCLNELKIQPYSYFGMFLP